jgi:hypothetical protein
MSQEFEGQEISEFIAALPSMKLEAPDSYQRGTYLNLNVEVRVRSVRYEEITSGKRKGDLQKVHVLAIENVSVVETITPQQRQAILEEAAKHLESAVIEAPDSGSLGEPVAAVLPAPVVDDQMTPDTLTEKAVPEEADSGWVYESPEYALPEASVGF